MSPEELEDLNNAIQEFYDNAFHPSMKFNISDEAKAIALKCMIIVWNENSKTKINNIKIERNEDTSLDEMIEDLPNDPPVEVVHESWNTKMR